MKLTKPVIKKPTVNVHVNKPTIKKPEIGKRSLNKHSLRVIYTLVKKELFNFFSTPLAYIIISLFIAVVSILFFAVGKFLQVGTTDLTNLFAYISFTFVIIVPAITMGSISKEKQYGTIEYLLTQPITEIQLLISKFIAYAIFIVILLLTTLPLVLMIGLNGQLDVGQVIMQYIGAWILGLCLVSVGIAVSALLKSEIAAFLMTIVIAALLIVIGSDILQLTFGLNFIIEKIGLLAHYQSISRGVLDIRDILYFTAFILAFLSIAFYLLVKDKFPPKDKHLRYARISLVVLILMTLLLGYLGQVIPGRIDFTSNKVYTLSQSSVNVINQATDLVSIKLYASNNLPLEFQAQIRNVQDLLRDYQTYSAGRVHFEFIPAAATTDDDNEAQKAGLQPIRFQVEGQDSSQVTVGYFGIALNYLDKAEVIDLNDQSMINNLEYNVTKKINKLTNGNLKTVGFVKEGVAYSTGAENTQTLTNEMSELFTVQNVDLSKDVPKEINTLVIAGPNAEFTAAQKQRILDFYTNGGSVFLLTNPVSVDTQAFTTTANANSLNDLFSNLGVTVDNNLAYDLEKNNLVNVGLLFPINYPFWLTASATSADISILKDVKEVSYLWGSTVSVDNSKLGDTKVYRLLETSNAGNTQSTGHFDLAPDQNWAKQDNDSVQTLAVALENNKGGKAVIIGDAKLIADDFTLASMSENLPFTLGSIEWLSGADGIASIQAKVRVSPRVSLNSSQTTVLTVVGIGLPIALIISIGVTRFYFRKRKQSKKYVEYTA